MGDRLSFGCTKPVMQPNPYPGDDALSLCPLATFRDDPHLEGVAFDLHLHWSKGILPDEGGMDDQANLVRYIVVATENGMRIGQARLQEVAQHQAEMKNRQANPKAGAARKPR